MYMYKYKAFQGMLKRMFLIPCIKREGEGTFNVVKLFTNPFPYLYLEIKYALTRLHKYIFNVHK